MNIWFLSLAALLQVALQGLQNASSQGVVYTALQSEVWFHSEAPLEDITARSSELRAAMDLESGEILFIVPIHSFEFEKKLMQKHFNEQYMESDKFPEARFEGQFSQVPVSIDRTGEYAFEGLLTLHGISRKISGTARLERQGEVIQGESKFQVRLEDHGIRIPRMVIKNIAEVVDVGITVRFTPESRE